MIWYVLSLLAAHFIGDWFLQSRKMAVAKSSNMFVLTKHVAIISLCLWIAAVPFVGLAAAGAAVFVNAWLHFVIDCFGWTVYKRCFSHLTIEQHFGNYWFYSTIAADQFLHLAIIFLLFL